MSDLATLQEICQKAQGYYYVGDVVTAIKLYAEAADGYEEVAEPVLAAKALILAGKAYVYTNEYESPLLALQKAQKLLNHPSEPVAMAALLRTRAVIHSLHSHLIPGYDDLTKSEMLLVPPVKNDEAEVILDINEAIATWTALADFYLISGEWGSAEAYLAKAFLLADEANLEVQYDLLVKSAQHHLNIRDKPKLARSVGVLQQMCPELGDKKKRPIAWVYLYALDAHSKHLDGLVIHARARVNDLFDLLNSLPPLVAEKLYVATQTNLLRSYISRLP